MEPSAAGYTNLALFLYDFAVLFISNTFAWHCPTRSVLLPFYRAHLRSRAHLEIGPVAAAAAAAAAAVVHDIFEPLPTTAGRGECDSAALFYVFHCLPGVLPRKAEAVFANVAPALAPGGVVYGATVPAHGVPHNWLGRVLMRCYNKRGVFDNYGDTPDGMREALEGSFEEWEPRVVGAVALFWGRIPKAKAES
ncbi:hypothetical protein BD413DRAFT_611967 [Trametes elegans]|nr:hypothetical protein BD413DRAFT_611967 [Trametes elegans]